MTGKQESFYRKYVELGEDEEAAALALGAIFSIKTWSKKQRSKKIEELLSNVNGVLFIDELKSSKKVRKNESGLEEKPKKNARCKKSDKIKLKTRPNRPETYSKTKYNTALDKIIEKLFALGGTNEEAYEALGIGGSTYYDWRVEHKTFNDSILRGKDFFASGLIESSLRKRAVGFSQPYTEVTTDAEGAIQEIRKKEKIYPPDTTAIKYFLNNRKAERWKDNPTEGSGAQDDALDRLISAQDEALD